MPIHFLVYQTRSNATDTDLSKVYSITTANLDDSFISVPLGHSVVEIAQQEDPNIRAIIDVIKSGKKIPANKIKHASPDLQTYWKCLPLLRIRDGLLYKKDPATSLLSRDYLIVVPKSLIPDVLAAAHDNPTSGHLGQDKTINNIRHRFFWPHWQADVKDYCNGCHYCSSTKITNT